MGVYEGYQRFKRSGGQITFFKPDYSKKKFDITHTSAGLIARTSGDGQFLIRINLNYTLEEQTKTLIHELLHLSGKFYKCLFNKELGNDEAMGFRDIDDAHKAINKLEQVIYKCQPILVAHLREKLIKTYGLESRVNSKLESKIDEEAENIVFFDEIKISDPVYSKLNYLNRFLDFYRYNSLYSSCGRSYDNKSFKISHSLPTILYKLVSRKMKKKCYEYFLNTSFTKILENYNPDFLKMFNEMIKGRKVRLFDGRFELNKKMKEEEALRQQNFDQAYWSPLDEESQGY